MKIGRLILIACLLVAVAALIAAALISHWQHTQTAFNMLPKLAMAVERYSLDLASRGQPLPSSVTLQDLESGGYISAKDVRAFDGAEVTFYPKASGCNPQTILVRVQMADGVQITAMADGSVKELPK